MHELQAAGTYALVYRAPQAFRVTVGALGAVSLPAGYLVYVGSAFGPGGLGGRLRHHLRPLARSRWHVDYLRPYVRLEGVWCGSGDRQLEHGWSAALPGLLAGSFPVRGFGASDCRCRAHLIHTTRPATEVTLGRRLARAAGGPVPGFMRSGPGGAAGGA